MMYDAGLYSRDGDEEDTEGFADFLDEMMSFMNDVREEGKEISSPPPSRGVKGESEKNEGRETEVKSSIEDAFDINIFKNIEKGGDNKSRNAHSPNEPEIIDIDDLEQTRKRKCLFEDHDDKPTGRKRLVVLGDDSKPVRRSTRKSFTGEEQRPLFNHYENGGGWWTEHMAGVDNEEVGCNDVWEGVGCTTLGGLEWH